MVEALTPPPPISPIVTIRPVEVVMAGQNTVATQTQNAVLAPHTVIEGFVLSRDTQNNPILRTPYGDLQLQSTVFLKTGVQVTIQTDATADGRARIITIEGKTPQEYAAVAQAGRGLTQDTITPSTLAGTQAGSAARPNTSQTPLQNNASLSALLVSRNTGNPTNNPLIASLNTAILPPMLQKLTAGTPLKVALLDLQFPSSEAVETETPPPLPNAPQAPSTGNARAVPNSLQSAQTGPQGAASTTPAATPISSAPIPNATTGLTTQQAAPTPAPISTPAQFSAAAQAYAGSLHAINPQPVPLPSFPPVSPQPSAYAPNTSTPAQPQATVTSPPVNTPPQIPLPSASTVASFSNAITAEPSAPTPTTTLAQPVPTQTTTANQAEASTPPVNPPATAYAPRVAAAAYQQLAAGTSSYSPSAAAATAMPSNVPVAAPLPNATSVASNVPFMPAAAPAIGTNIPPSQAPVTSNPAAIPSAPISTPTPSQPPSQPSPPPPGVQAVVIGHEPDGASILHSALGVVKLYTPQPLPVGSKLALDMMPDPQAPVPPTPLIPKEPVVDVHATKLPWYAEHEDQLASLAQTPSPQTPATNPLETALRSLLLRIPTTGTGLASGLLTFIAAVKAGDARQWLDKRTIDALSNDIPRLGARITADTAQMQELWNQSPIENWAMMLIPIAHQGQIDHARFFVRDDEGDPEKQGGGGKRFLVEIDFSQLGPMQFDGFVRRADSKQFDLVIRTQRTIDPSLANDIRTIFDNTVQTTGYGGYLSFQHGTQHFVRPLAELKTGAAPDTGTIMA